MSNDDQLWYHLYDSSTGLPYKGTRATFVSLKVPMIAEFCDAVKIKSRNKLASVDAEDLLVFKNKDSFDKRNSEEEKVNHDMILDKGRATTGFLPAWRSGRK